MVTLILAGACFSVTALFILSEGVFPRVPGIVMKALIIPLLLLILIVNLSEVESSSMMLIAAALIFSWTGDILLGIRQQNDGIFAAGLASFMAAHVFYIVLFFSTPDREAARWNILFLAPLILYGASLIGLLYRKLGSMRFPVMLYSFVILVMLAGAEYRYGRVNPASFRMVLAGAILFVISDSTLAISRYGHPFRLSRLVVMLTYASAQTLIVTGYIRQFRTSLL